MPASALAVASTLFDGWDDVGRVALTCVLGYAGVVVLVRISGKRTLSQLNAFDWIVTVAFGSTLATTMLSPDVAVAEGLTAFTVLAALQYAVALVSSRSRPAAKLVKSEPALLVHRGALLRTALRRERISEEEVLQALRTSGVGSLEDVEAVVLETNGNLAVIPQTASGDVVLADVAVPDEGREP